MKTLFTPLLAGLLAVLAGCASPPSANTPSMQAGPEVRPVAPQTPMAQPSRATGPAAAAPTSAPVATPAIASAPISPAESATRPAAAPEAAPLAPPADLWERIRRGFAMPDLQSDLVPGREQWYAVRPDELVAMTERSSKYLFHIVEEIERRKLPTELALLPFIESAFNPQAYSRARAAGMWQFMPGTGKLYQLKQNAFRDDRRDVLASTRAALDYLEKLYAMFGDWHLALAAYNWGEGSVGRAIAKNQRSGKPTGYLDLKMPNETRYYVPKLQAVKNIVADPRKFGVQLPAIENHPYFDSVAVTRDIDVALAAKLAEVPLEDFRALNPSLHRPVILAAGTPQILLPWKNAAIFQRNLDAYSGAQLSSWTVWIAPSTMKTAEAAKRVKMNENDLRRVNNIPTYMIIRSGSTLLIPRPAGQERDVSPRIAENGQLALTPETALRRVVLKAGKHGDSVANVARRYRLAPAKVAEWNKVSASATFKAGQEIVVYRWVPLNTAPQQALAPRPPARLAKR